LILLGEHAAVYGQPALIAAVDPRARVEVELANQGLGIELADFHRQLDTTWQQAIERAQRSREAWQRYVDAPTPDQFAAVGSGSPDGLALVALGEVATALEDRRLPPLGVRVESSLPVGSGFGSSASIAVALIGGVLALVDGAVDFGMVDALVLEVERRQHGLPSGVDHKTVLYGGVVLAERRSDGELRISRLDSSSPILGQLQVYQTGQPAETTGEVVAAVKRYRDEEPGRVDTLLERMGATVESFRDELEAPGCEAQRLNELIRDYQRCLEDLGVVPAEVRETIREVEDQGGAAKISGAGALTGSAAGCLLVLWPGGPPAELPAQLREYQRQAVDLGVEGLRVEEEE
jgi:mevalonate kinase